MALNRGFMKGGLIFCWVFVVIAARTDMKMNAIEIVITAVFTGLLLWLLYWHLGKERGYRDD